MEDNIITVHVEEADGSFSPIAIPTDMGINLMEALKGSGYPIEATCGGMALCATCHIEVVEGQNALPEESDDELDMLDTIPNLTDNSRLSCQLRPNEALDGLKLRILGDK